jgi:hypothetical protein
MLRTLLDFLGTFFIVIMSFLAWTPSSWSYDPIDGFGNLKFGMTQQEVEALPDCSTTKECLYEIAGKNRYLTMTYHPLTLIDTVEPSSTLKNPQLTRIDIDMGSYSEPSYSHLFFQLKKTYPLTHDLTEQQDTLFQRGDSNELSIGFADARILLTIVRRPFGNMVINMVYQNEREAQNYRDTLSSPKD